MHIEDYGLILWYSQPLFHHLANVQLKRKGFSYAMSIDKSYLKNIMINKNFTQYETYNMRHCSAPAIIFAHHSFRISAVRQPHGQLVPLAAQVHHRAVHLGQVDHLTD